MNETNYARMSGALEVKLKYIAVNLCQAGVITSGQIDKVMEICQKEIEEARDMSKQ